MLGILSEKKNLSKINKRERDLFWFGYFQGFTIESESNFNFKLLLIIVLFFLEQFYQQYKSQ